MGKVRRFLAGLLPGDGTRDVQLSGDEAAYSAVSEPRVQPVKRWDDYIVIREERLLDELDRVRREASDPYIRGELASLHADLSRLVVADPEAED